MPRVPVVDADRIHVRIFRSFPVVGEKLFRIEEYE